MIGSTFIDDTFAEAFPMRLARLIITAYDEHWLNVALSDFSGYGSSVIGCDAETGVEWHLGAETPDGRPGASVLAFSFSHEQLGKAVVNRVGQSLMTCPTTAVFDGLRSAEKKMPLGKHLRYFGDGFQKSKVIDGRRFWRIPTMEGEFVVEESAGTQKGVAGGNLVIQATTLNEALEAARQAVAKLATLPNVITPFPGGVVGSGSKVGSRYKGLKASTSDPFCPTLRGRVKSKLHPDANAALEIVINGTDEHSVGSAMATAIRAAVGPGIVSISAGNYGGKLGPFRFELRSLLT